MPMPTPVLPLPVASPPNIVIGGAGSPKKAADFVYAGCYITSTEVGSLQGATDQKSDDPQQTNDLCSSRCKALGFSMAATQHGMTCHCLAWLTSEQKVDDSRCDSPCAGAPTTDSCGGSSTADTVLSIYSDDGKVKTPFTALRDAIEVVLGDNQLFPASDVEPSVINDDPPMATIPTAPTDSVAKAANIANAIANGPARDLTAGDVVNEARAALEEAMRHASARAAAAGVADQSSITVVSSSSTARMEVEPTETTMPLGIRSSRVHRRRFGSNLAGSAT